MMSHAFDAPEPLKPFSQACQNNRDPILAQLRRLFADCSQVLEIGSGTGQHAVYFAQALTHLTWQPSDLPELHPGIQLWLDEAALTNLRPPLALDVGQAWPALPGVDAVFSANTAHILAWPQVMAMFEGVARLLPAAAPFVLYGPMNYGGQYTSDSNARFDVWLKAQDPVRGIRDLDQLQPLAHRHGLALEEDHEMPANNRLLVFRKRP